MNLRRSLNRSFIVPLLFAFALTPATRAAIPESQLKLAGAIPLTTELLQKMQKFLTSLKSDAAAKAELAAVTKENKDNPPMTGEAWGSLITRKSPKTVAANAAFVAANKARAEAVYGSFATFGLQ